MPAASDHGPCRSQTRAPVTGCRPGRRAALQAGFLALPGLLTGCTIAPGRDHAQQDAPQALPLSRPVRTAWVLSSGGPRGFVHVGVLRALDELVLVPDLIVGASVGALVGSLRAAGVSVEALQALALDLQPWSMARWALGAQERFSGAPVAELVRAHAPQPLLQHMPIAMACVALRHSDQQVVAFTHGDAGLAVQASAAIEGQFAPVQIRGQRYGDADWHSPLPVRLARTLGATKVLAVDASAHFDRAPPGAERYRASDLRKLALVAADAGHADLVLKPDFGYWVSLSREFKARAIEAGYRATLEQASALRALHQA